VTDRSAPDDPGASVEALEERIWRLRAAVRRAVLDRDAHLEGALRRELSEAQQAWDRALDATREDAPRLPAAFDPGATIPDGLLAGGMAPDDAAPGPGALDHAALDHAAAGAAPGRGRAALLPLREQVHEALSLLQVPAAPRIIATVHEAFFATTFPTARLTSLRRDEERSFTSTKYARPYYICAALSADYLSPSRGLLAVSTWPLERRIIGSLSPRADFLASAINIAQAIEQIPDPVPAARALLTRLAANIWGSSSQANTAAGPHRGRIDPQAVIRAAQAELEVHAGEDRRIRAEAASRAREQLSDVEQLFGAASFREAARRDQAPEGR
jgi:hypothetical protein